MPAASMTWQEPRHRGAWARWILGVTAGTVALAAPPALPRMLLLDGAVAGTEVTVVGERGAILSREHAWRSAAVPARATLTGVSFAPDATQQGWAVGHDALILATGDGGRTWMKQYQGADLQKSFLDVLALSARHAIAVGADGLFFETKDGGTTWSQRKIGDVEFHLNRLSRGPTGTLYLAGERGTLLRSADAGGSWTSIAAPYDGSFYGILPLDRRTLLAYGLRGHVFRSIDDGASWDPVATAQPVLLAAGVKLKSNFILLAGTAGTLLLSRDYGKTFAPVASPAKAVAELLELPEGDVLALGEAGATVIARPQ